MSILKLFILFFISSCLHVYNIENKIEDVEVVMQKNQKELFIIKSILENKFNKTQNPQYKLFISLAKLKSQSGITTQAYTNSFQVEVTVNFRLLSVKENKIIYSSFVTKTSSYVSESGKLIAEKVGEDSLNEVLSQKIAEEIYLKIQEHFFAIK